MMHVERVSNLSPTPLKYECLKSLFIYLTDDDLTHVVHTSMVYNEEK